MTKNYSFFTEREAWNIFRLAAFGEAFGWTLLGTGVVWRAAKLPNYVNVLKVLGQIHGTFFLLYFGAIIAVGASLGWSRRFLLLALAASVPPYGTLLFEKIMAWRRQLTLSKSYRQVIVRALIIKDGKLLAIQASDNSFWSLPGGKVAVDETAESALAKHIYTLFNTKAQLGAVQYIYEYRHHGTGRMELFFNVTLDATADVLANNRTHTAAVGIDDWAFIDPKRTPDLKPEFLQSLGLTKTAKMSGPVKIITS